MRYTLRRLVLGEPNFLEISEDEFTALKSIQEKLLAVLDIEGTFDLLFGNYREFEQRFVKLSWRFGYATPRSQRDERRQPLWPCLQMNRRLTNLLSSVRLYLDQVPQNLNSLYGKNAEHTATFKQWCKEQYDSSRAYRVMEALRNHAQHNGLPVHVLTSYSEPEDAPVSMHMGLRLYIDIQRLKQDPKFKKTVLAELE